MNDLLAVCTREHAPDGRGGVSGEDSARADNNGGAVSTDDTLDRLLQSDDEEWAGFSSDEKHVTEQYADTGTHGQRIFETTPHAKSDEDCLVPRCKAPDATPAKPTTAAASADRIREDEETTPPGPGCENPSCASTTSITRPQTSDDLLFNACIVTSIRADFGPQLPCGCPVYEASVCVLVA